MPRKRLRTFLDAVIADDDLRSNAERVAAAVPDPSEPPALTVAAPAAGTPPASLDAFPPPPWELPAATAPAAGDGEALGVGGAPPAANGGGSAAPAAAVALDAPMGVPTAPEPPATIPGSLDAAIELPLSPEPDAAAPPALNPHDAMPITPDSPTEPIQIAPPREAVTPPAIAANSAADALRVATPAPPREPAPTVAADDAAGAVLLGSAADTSHASRRRRRSASLLPPLPSATDAPEDALGRVAILSIPAPAGAGAPSPDGDRAAAAAAAQPDPAPVVTVGGDAPLAGWLPVAALGVVLVIVFVIGVVVTH